MPGPDSPDPRSGLQEKAALFRRYLDLTRRMRRRFRSRDVTDDALAAFLRERTALARRIDGIDATLRSTGVAIAGDPGRPDFPPDGEGARPQPSQLGDLLTELRAVERDLMGMLEREAEETRRKLLRMREGRKAARGYGRNTAGVPRFLDTRR